MTETESTDTRPDWLLPKFKTVEDQARAYIEAQKLIGQRPNPEPQMLGLKPAPLGGNPQDFEPDGGGQVAKKIADINSALSALQAGDASALAKLTALGADQRLVQAALGVMQDTQRRYQARLHEAAGGAADYEALNRWIIDSDEVESFERDSYAQALATGDIQRATDAIKHMTNRHRESTGYTPAQLTHTVPGSAPKRVAAYENFQEVAAATSDPRYDKQSRHHDPNYAAEVNARMQISPCLDKGFAIDVASRNG